jgi:hypothetical protein
VGGPGFVPVRHRVRAHILKPLSAHPAATHNKEVAVSDWQNYPVERAKTDGREIETNPVPNTLAAQAHADRARGMTTVGTRGYADTEAFERDTRDQ